MRERASEDKDKDVEGASQLDLLLGDLEDDEDLATIEAELGISTVDTGSADEIALRPLNKPLIAREKENNEEQNELAIVEEFNQKYRNDAARPDSKSIKAIFVVKFDVNEGNISLFTLAPTCICILTYMCRKCH